MIVITNGNGCVWLIEDRKYSIRIMKNELTQVVNTLQGIINEDKGTSH